MKFQFKHWKAIHSYVGLFLAFIFIIVGVTGFLMMDKEMFGLKRKEVRFGPLLSYYEQLPEEQKDYKEREVIVLFTQDGHPVEIASDHGAILIAETEERWVKANDSALGLAVTKKAFAKTDVNISEYRPLYWGKIVDDLHTGKFFGGWLNLLYYFAAFSMVGLTLTGVYLWYKPWAQKRKRSTSRAPKAKVLPTGSASPERIEPGIGTSISNP